MSGTEQTALLGFYPLIRDERPNGSPSEGKRSSEATGREDDPTCLCVSEGHPGRQDVGHYANGVYVRTGETACRICNGTGMSPRARGEQQPETD